MSEVTKKDFLAWKEYPVTKEIMIALFKEREECKEALVVMIDDRDSALKMAGKILALESMMTIDFVDVVDEEDQDEL